MIRAQLNEKRKQIEQERQQEKQKRVSSDHNFRQEVLKTLKNQQHTDMDTIDFCRNNNNDNNDENLTFEIHELNPIRREKTFTSIPSSISNSNNKSMTSTFVRKNLFSASDDLKASMTDLNYANAKDYHQSSSTSSKSDSNSTKSMETKIISNEQKLTEPTEQNKLEQEIQPQQQQQLTPPSSSNIQPLATQSQTTPS
ncbi:hypothetical protein BLA29_011585, partial [Euroglyphus maynei]